MNNWDRTTLYLPFSRGGLVVGAPIYVPLDADDATLELARRAVEDALTAITARVYEIADGTARGTPVADQRLLTLRDRRSVSRRTRSTRRLPAATVATGSLRQPTFWCTKRAA